jgi:MerR family redox-sensitive transcriptional activator SoxR
MALLTIGEVARRSGVRASALRWYEQVGLLTPPERRSGQRRYAASVLAEVAAIRVARAAGFTVSEVRQLRGGSGEEPSGRWRALGPAKLRMLRERIEAARAMERLVRRGMRCRCRVLADCALLRDAAVSASARGGRARTASRR